MDSLEPEKAPKDEPALTELAAEIIGDSMKVKWYWISGEMDAEEPSHHCTPDCAHWKGKSEAPSRDD